MLYACGAAPGAGFSAKASKEELADVEAVVIPASQAGEAPLLP